MTPFEKDLIESFHPQDYWQRRVLERWFVGLEARIAAAEPARRRRVIRETIVKIVIGVAYFSIVPSIYLIAYFS